MASEALAQKAVANIVKESDQSGSEPPTAITGKGTAGDPYDGGNAPEQAQVPGGKIEHSAPTGYPEHQGSGAPQTEPNVEEAQSITASKSHLEKEQEAAASFKENGGNPAAAKGANLDTAQPESARGARRKPSDQRDVSPGTLPDGSHVETAGDRGEVYEVSKMSKFKNKMGFGKN